ncbi:MAG: YidH family protein [Hyphomicrobiaceae bacterium]
MAQMRDIELTPLAKAVIGIAALLLLLALLVYGLDGATRSRFWQDLTDRRDGLFSFRFLLQPLMAAIAAFHDGYRDAQTGRSPYLWTVLTDRGRRTGRVREALIATARIILLGFVMDALYQAFVLGTFYPGEMLAIALFLAFVPYVLLRGPFSRISTWLLDHMSKPEQSSGMSDRAGLIEARRPSLATIMKPVLADRPESPDPKMSPPPEVKMEKRLLDVMPTRPEKIAEQPVAQIPNVDGLGSGQASTVLSQHRTTLSTHRTGLSEHRTSLSEYRTDLSSHRTDLSTDRTGMSMRRTGMSFQRTRMSAERTLMSVIRTSLSLISFGFTIYQFFEKAVDQGWLEHAAAPRNFGITLVLLGIIMLLVGIAYHVQFMLGLRQERVEMHADGLIYAQSRFPPSMTLVTAIILLGVGVFAILSMLFKIGPF